ncbi:MAG: hypothetical protein EPN97_16625 [Alphaproteobacteria bacterium]|nr:MAG: hypothetical protein EPN97_16625 [Alphaproteobacteria bacterium]
MTEEVVNNLRAEKFFDAICADNVAVMEDLIAQGQGVNVLVDGMTPLTRAVEKGQKRAAELLLREGAEIEGRSWEGRTALSYAARGEMDEGNLELAKRLLQKGANPHSTDDAGNSVLMHAALAGSTEVIGLLLGKGVDINHARKSGDTALHHAAWGGHAEAVVLLIESGADASRDNEDGEDAKCSAAAMGHPEIVTLITATVLARERRLAAERAEEERLNNLKGIVSAVHGGIDAPVQVRKPLKLLRGFVHG